MNFKSLREQIRESPLKEVVNRGNFYFKKNISRNIHLFREFQANQKALQELNAKAQMEKKKQSRFEIEGAAKIIKDVISPKNKIASLTSLSSGGLSPTRRNRSDA